MIRVHCFVSCLCDLLHRANEEYDERPFYFGVWDSAFSVSREHVLSYHSPGSDQAFFRHWYQELYGAQVHEWYDHGASKQRNVGTLTRLVADQPRSRAVIAMLDLHVLPERENKFNQDPFPHYVLLEPTEDDHTWLMRDPDFRWQGELSKERVLQAVQRPAAAGGFHCDAEELRAPTRQAIQDCFEASFKPHENPFTSALQAILEAHAAEGRLSSLILALREIPVIAIRKYAYEHGFAFFWRAGKMTRSEFMGWCDAVDRLVKNYTLVHYRCLKLAATGDRRFLAQSLALLDEQHALEGRIKARLGEVFAAWRAATGPGQRGRVTLSTGGDS